VIPLHPYQEKVGDLSGREQQVLELTAEGLTNAEIGKALFVSEETVKSHLRNLLAKLQARSRAHAVALGFRHGLIS
jgi:DNA-binding CsgD family transcriptional regulator